MKKEDSKIYDIDEEIPAGKDSIKFLLARKKRVRQMYLVVDSV